MDLTLATWLFATATALQPGLDHAWPIMAPKREAAGLETRLAVPAPPAPHEQHLCATAPGVYVVTMRLGFVPGEAAAGRLWLESSGGDVVHMMEWRAAPGEWTTFASSAPMAADGPTCWRLRYDATGPAVVNHDPRVTVVTIHRAGP
jgi:hypothetical protein